MELDEKVAWNPKAPGAEDYVIYSSRAGDVPYQEPGNVRGTRRIEGWYKANQASTYKVQVRDGAGWTTINNGGNGVAVGVSEPMVFSEPRPAGEHRLVATFAVAPTAFTRSAAITLGVDAAMPAAGG